MSCKAIRSIKVVAMERALEWTIKKGVGCDDCVSNHKCGFPSRGGVICRHNLTEYFRTERGLTSV
jgi:hypothetical protein